MYKKTYTIEILFEADQCYELAEHIHECISNTLDYSDSISGYDINIQLEDNIW